MNVSAIILAAGKGTRMRSDRAKVLHEVCGRPMLGYVLDAAAAAGASPIAVTIGHQADSVKQAFAAEKLSWVLQEPQLGTGHAVTVARNSVPQDGDVLVLCGDAPLVRAETLANLLSRHRETESAATVLIAEVPDPTGYGRVLTTGDGSVVDMVEHLDATDEQRQVRDINSSIYAFRAADLFSALAEVKNDNAKKEYYLPDVLKVLLARGKGVVAFRAADSAEVLGINTRSELAAATDAMRRRLLERHMAGGVTIVDPDLTYVEWGVEIGEDTVVMPFSVLRKGTVVGRHCEVGPFAHLRTGTVMEDRSEIGNFVEVKKSRVGARTKAKHLTYLGDATIGSDANIGAGTITANYDGKA
ncbi:MAG: NTP transferase domain-containing protein, partial [Planctomycetota bacterium]